MKHLLLGLLIVAMLAITACLGHRSSGSTTAASRAGQPGGGYYIDDPSDPSGPKRRTIPDPEWTVAPDASVSPAPGECTPRNDLTHESCDGSVPSEISKNLTQEFGTADDNCTKKNLIRYCVDNGCGNHYYTKWMLRNADGTGGQVVETYPRCQPYTYKSCSYDNQTIAHNGTITKTFYSANSGTTSAPCSGKKQNKTGTCFDGELTWSPELNNSYKYTSCQDVEEDNTVCTDSSGKYKAGDTVKSVTHYNTQYCQSGSTCSKKFTYVCQNDGHIGPSVDVGEYQYTTA